MMDQERWGWLGLGIRMVLAKAEFKFPQVWAPGGLSLKEMGFLCQGQQDWKGVGETLPTGAGEWSGVASMVDTLLMEASPVLISQ